MATVIALAVLLLVVAVVLLSRARNRSQSSPAAQAEEESLSLEMTLGRSGAPHAAAPVEAHPRSPSGLAQPRLHERVTPYVFVFSPAAPGTAAERVRSSKDRSVSYDVDASRLTCTCPDFQRRAHLPETSFGRCCKHLLRTLDKGGHLANADKWVKAIENDGYGAPSEAWLIELETAPPVLVGVAPGKAWVNVYAHTPREEERIKTASGRIRRYGWNVDEDRWASRESPPGARELTPLMKLVL